MNSDFSRVLTLLRKEQNISQKKAAADMGISQGLLSHYEKGKRECGLDFLVKCADYYNVSCDYLLGRSPEPQGKTISIEEIQEDDNANKERITNGGVMVSFNKKLIINSISVIFSLIQKSKSPNLVKSISNYLMLAIYQMFRIIYSSNAKNDENFFTVSKITSAQLTSAALLMANSEVLASAKALEHSSDIDINELYITTAKLSEEYPNQYSSMVNLIKNSEAKIQLLSNADK